MRNLVVLTALAAAMIAFSSPAFAGLNTQVPEPVSLTLLAGGVAAIAAIRHFRK